MSKFTGRDVKIGIGQEEARGTATASTFYIPHREIDFNDKANVIQDNQSYGIIEEGVGGRVVNRWAEGSFSGNVRSQSIALLLKCALGSLGTVTNSPEANVHTHTITILQSHEHPSLTLNIEDPNGDVQFARAMIASLEINAELNEYIIFNVSLISEESASGSFTPAYVDDENFAANDLTLKIPTTFEEISTAAAIKAKSVSILIEKDLEKNDVLGQVAPDDILNKLFRITVTVTKDYIGDTCRAYYMGGTAMALRITMKDTNATIGATSNATIEFDLNKVIVTDWTTSRDLDGIATEEITFKGVFKIADSRMIEVMVINEKESY